MSSAMTVVARPEDARVDPEKLEAVFARARRDVDDGVLESCAVAVARDGKLAGHRWYGHAIQGGTDRAVDERTLFSIFSSTKAIVGVAVWALFEDGLLRLEERVAEIIPEFASNGKDAVTVERAMLHIGGFPLAPFAMPGWHSKEARLEAFARWRLTFEPGSQFQYHATSAHWVLAEIIERRTGGDFRDYIRERILDPMGLEDLHVGLAEEEHQRIADMKYMSPPEPPPGGWGEVTPELLRNSNTTPWRTSGLPGGGGVGRAADLAMFYQPLVNDGLTADGSRILKAETMEWATTVRTGDRHRDPLRGHPVNRALAVVVAGEDGQSHLRGFGRTVSHCAFGHGGAGGQIGWGDPATGISVGYVTNSFVDVMTEGRRITAISSLAAQCGL